MNEQEFYEVWQRDVRAIDPFDVAVEGGGLAENPGLIFIAGYQACIQATFPELDKKLWYSFAVSEDRSPDSERPGVTRDEFTITGFKTWIAAVNQVDVLVLKVGNGEEAVYGTVPARSTEVILSSKQEPGFLPDMSQGQAEFRGAELSLLKDPSGVANFGKSEPFYIYLAFLGRLITLQGPIARQAEEALAAQRVTQDLVSLDSKVSAILEQMKSDDLQLGANWQTDRRLFSMYSKGIQSALS